MSTATLSSLAALTAPRKELINGVSTEVIEMVRGTLLSGQQVAGSARSALAPLAVLTCLEQRLSSAVATTAAPLDGSSSNKPPMEAINAAFAVFCVVDRFLSPAGLLKEIADRGEVDSELTAVHVVGSVFRESLVGTLIEGIWGSSATIVVEVEDPQHLLTVNPEVEAILSKQLQASEAHQARSLIPFVKEFTKRAEGLAKRWENSYGLLCGLRGVKLVLSTDAVDSVKKVKAEQAAALEAARLAEIQERERLAAAEAARLAAKAAPTVTKDEVRIQMALIRTIKRLLTVGATSHDRAHVHLQKHRIAHYVARLQRALDAHDRQQQQQALKDAESESDDDDEYQVGSSSGTSHNDAEEEEGTTNPKTKNGKKNSKNGGVGESFMSRLQLLQGDLVREMSETAAKQELAALVSKKGVSDKAESAEGDDLEAVEGRDEEAIDDSLLTAAGGGPMSTAKLPVYYSPFNIITDIQQHTSLSRRLPGGANPSPSGYPMFASPSIVGTFVSFPKNQANKADTGFVTTPHGAKVPAGGGRTKLLLNEIEDNRKFLTDRKGLTKCLNYEDRSYDAVPNNEKLFDLLWRTTGLVTRPPGAPHPGPYTVPKNKGMRFIQHQRELGIEPDHPSTGAISPIDGAYLRSDPKIDRRAHPFSWREVLIYPPTTTSGGGEGGVEEEEDLSLMTSSSNQAPTFHAEWQALQKINADMNLGGGGVLSGSIFDFGTTTTPSATVAQVAVAQRSWFQTFEQWEATVDVGRIPTLREKIIGSASSSSVVVGGRNTMLAEYAQMCSGGGLQQPQQAAQSSSSTPGNNISTLAAGSGAAPGGSAIAAGAKRPRD